MKPLLKLDTDSSSDDYTDFVYHFAVDKNGLGGFIQVTLVNEVDHQTAMLGFCITNEFGDYLIEHSAEIDRRDALKMISVNHIDGELYVPN